MELTIFTKIVLSCITSTLCGYLFCKFLTIKVNSYKDTILITVKDFLNILFVLSIILSITLSGVWILIKIWS